MQLSHDGLEFTELSSTVLNADSVLGIPVRIRLSGKFLLVPDLSGAPFVHVLDRASGRLIQSIGEKGGGPGEFTLVPRPIEPPSGGRPTIRLYDQAYQRIVAFDPGTLRLIDPTDEPSASVTIAQRGVTDLAYRSDGEVLVTMYTRSGPTLDVYDTLGALTRTLGPIDLKDARLPIEQIQGAYNSHLCVEPGGNRVALAYHYAGRIDLFDGTTTHPVAVKVPFVFEPRLSRHPLSRLLAFKSGDANVRMAYSDCASGSRYFYALFQRRLHGKRGVEIPRERSFVHVFDWNGNLVKIFRLDHSAISLAIDPQERNLFTVTWPDGSEPTAVRLTALPLLGSLSAAQGPTH